MDSHSIVYGFVDKQSKSFPVIDMVLSQRDSNFLLFRRECIMTKVLKKEKHNTV